MIGGVVMTTLREDPRELEALQTEFEKMGLQLFHVDAEATGVRRGIAPCLLDAWQLALDAKCDYVVQMDAGGSHRLADMPVLLTALEHADMVIGSRFCEGAMYLGNPKRALMSRTAAVLCNLAQPGAHYSDWTSGFRAFRAPALRELKAFFYRSRMHFWQAEVLAHAGELGLRIVEAPIVYQAGRSSFNRKVAWEAFQGWTHVLNHVGAVKEPK